MLEHEAILAGLKNLPAAPLVLVRILMIMDDPKTGSNELIEAVELDPGVTANVLRMCNSTYYAGTRQLSTLQEAVHRLGMRTIQQMVTMRESESLLGGAHEGYGLAAGDLWRHSVSTALACRLLAHRVGYPRVSVAFTGGLLHDLGKIVLDVFLRKRYQEVRARVEQGATFQDAERDVFGVEHADLGARIAEKWGFPEGLVRAMRFHHQPEEADGDGELCALVHLGDSLSHWLGVGLGRPGLANRFAASAVRMFSLQPEDLDRILIELVEKFEETEQSLAA
jgi:putative nucleotidyltransferase with HDIG domain